MIKFEVTSTAILVRPVDLAVAEIEAIWTADVSKKKEIAQRMLKVVFYLADDESPCVDMEKKDARRFAFRNSRLDEESLKPEQVKMIDDAVTVYKKHNYDAIKRSLVAMKNNIDAMAEMLANTPPSISCIVKKVRTGEFDEDDKPIMADKKEYSSNEEEIGKFYERMDQAMSTYDSLYDKWIKQKAENKTRGDAQLSLLDLGVIMIPKNEDLVDFTKEAG